MGGAAVPDAAPVRGGAQPMRAQRELDLELLDGVTWPDYAWEWLRYVGAHPRPPLCRGARPAGPALLDASQEGEGCTCRRTCRCLRVRAVSGTAASERLSSPAQPRVCSAPDAGASATAIVRLG